ncbi:MFS transporter [Streptomyces sp. NPDC051561]|uniref:MFS transporter n=1 Tax=Streptomyces sp. NPDC051561 TaxID=3365658 RepID=UPI00378EF3DF
MSEPTPHGVALLAARRRYCTLSALFWLPLGLTIGAQILLFTERGLSLPQLAGLFAAHSLTVAVLELPTGGLSDVLGRRPVLAAAGVLNAVAFTLQALGTSYGVLLLGMMLMGAARALSSGPAESWYVDTVQAHAGPGAELRTGLSRGSTVSNAALALGTLAGGALPWLLDRAPDLAARLEAATGGFVVPLAVPRLVGALLLIGYVLYVLSALREPPRRATTLRSVLRGVPPTVAGGLRLGVTEVTVRRLMLTAGAGGVAMSGAEFLTPSRAALLTGAPGSGAALYSVLACAGFATAAFGSSLAPLAARLAGGGERAIVATLTVGASGLLLLGVTTSFIGPLALALAVAGYLLCYLGLGAAGPNQNDLLHHRVDSAGRATALSVQSLALQLAGAAGSLVVGVLPTGPLPWLFTGAVLLAGALLWVRRPAPPRTPESTPEAHTESTMSESIRTTNAT